MNTDQARGRANEAEHLRDLIEDEITANRRASLRYPSP
jgi:hypothetical protein